MRHEIPPWHRYARNYRVWVPDVPGVLNLPKVLQCRLCSSADWARHSSVGTSGTLRTSGTLGTRGTSGTLLVSQCAHNLQHQCASHWNDQRHHNRQAERGHNAGQQRRIRWRNRFDRSGKPTREGESEH